MGVTEPPDSGAGVHLTEEFDSLKHTMPNAIPVIAAMVAVALVLGVAAFVLRARPVAAGSIDGAYAATIPGQGGVLAVVNLSLRNVTEKPLRLLNVNVAVRAKGSKYSDDFGPVSDFSRYFQAAQGLEQHAKGGLERDLKIAPMGRAEGTVMVTFPLTLEEFEGREGLMATLTFEDHAPVKITTGKME